jgi:NAD(P)-dependent dehydrogenase (short-subunit alcohol dehydrogenase family)
MPLKVRPPPRPACEGAHLALAARREDVLLEVQAGLETRGGEAKSLVAAADVTDREQIKSLVARAEEELGPVDILVNCAGVMYYALMLGLRANRTRAQISVPARTTSTGTSLGTDWFLNRVYISVDSLNQVGYRCYPREMGWQDSAKDSPAPSTSSKWTIGACGSVGFDPCCCGSCSFRVR